MKILSSKLCESNGKIGYFCPGCGHIHFINIIPNNHPCWNFNGDLECSTFSPSILVTGLRTCHSFIRNGYIEYLTDCTHKFAGKAIDLPDLPRWVHEGHHINPGDK